MLAHTRRPTKAMFLLALPMVLLGALILPGEAGAVSAKNRTTITLLPGAAKKLGAKDIRLVSTGLARGKGRQVLIPVRGGRIAAKSASLLQAGGFEIRARAEGRRRVKRLRISRLKLNLGNRSVLLGRASGQRGEIALFKVKHRPRAARFNRNAKTAKLGVSRLVPTRALRRLFSSRLGLKHPRAGAVARLSARADLNEFILPPITPPPLKPLPPEPEKLGRPVGAVNIASAQITWCVRASWIRYIGNGAVSNGATRETPFVVNEGNLGQVCDLKKKNVKPTSGATSYRYGFAFKEGWYDPASGRAALYFTGRVHFRYPERGIDLDFNDPEVEINGAETRLIFRMEGREDTEIPSHRTVFTEHGDPVPELDASNPGQIKSPMMQGWLPETSGAGIFADFYLPPNNDFGWVSVEFALPE